MTIGRRLFFSLLLASRVQKLSLRVTVIETFRESVSLTALLVHHVDPPHRMEFAEWLRANPRTSIRVRNGTRQEAVGMIFRVRACFGRGLILLQTDFSTSEGDILTIDAV